MKFKRWPAIAAAFSAAESYPRGSSKADPRRPDPRFIHPSPKSSREDLSITIRSSEERERRGRSSSSFAALGFFLMQGNSLRPWIRPSVFVAILISSGLVCYSAFSSWKYRWACPVAENQIQWAAPPLLSPAPEPAASPPTNISHILFGIGGSARTWHGRRGYSELWWRPGVTRGFVWLDEEPPGGADSWPRTCPPYLVSSDSSRFGQHAPPARIANIGAEMYFKLIVSGKEPGVRWLVMGDDDTVFFPDNLVAVLNKYDHEQMWYIGGASESVEQDLLHSYSMAFGGGGFAISLPAVAELAPAMNRCLERYNDLYGSDQRVHACLSELGVPLTREPGFHQVDLRGDPYGMLAAHPAAPLVSLHHLDYVEPISPRQGNRLDALSSLVRASRLDPARTLMQTICYDHARGWSVSVAWGYSVELYPRLLPVYELETPLQTFQTWRSYQSGPFTFNTRPFPQEPCERPVTFFLERVRRGAAGATVSEYSVHANNAAVCQLSEFGEASKVKFVRVVAPIMDPEDWKKAPRRQCCDAEVGQQWWGTSLKMEVRIRPCLPGKTRAMPP